MMPRVKIGTMLLIGIDREAIMVNDNKNTPSKQGKHALRVPEVDKTQVLGNASVEAEDTVFSQDAYPSGESRQPVFAGAQFGMRAAVKPKRNHGKIAALVIGVVVAIAAIVYIAGAIFFMNRFFPSTFTGDTDLSMRTISEVQQQLDQAISDYELTVTGQGFRLELSSEDTGISVDTVSVVEGMHADANPWAWPIEVFRTHDETGKLAASYNESGLEETVRAAVDEFNADKEMPVDATIAFDESLDAFAVVPERAGTALDVDAVISAVDDAVVSFEESVKLTSDELQQPKVLSTEPKLQQAADQANSMITADLTLTMAGDVAAEVDASLISQWIVLDEDLAATLDQDALTAWVDELTADCNTIGTTRTYTRADGKVITVSGGPYGWEVDRDALLVQVQEAVAAGAVASQEIPCSSHGSAYNGVGERDWGNRYIDIDLAEQHVRFYDESGTLVWESDCISGTPDGEHDTSVGVFWLNSKESPSMLIGYENGKKIYETEVSYWMPFDGNSIGLHDANWQPDFGGSMYAEGYGSHGCVNLPVDKAAELYDLVQPGDCVVSHW